METKWMIKIENQSWVYDEEEDLCSHGEIYLNIDGTIITQTGFDEEWGISETALALLRTINQDYICDPIKKEGLILHGCGTILMSGCPISIHWSVKHKENHVILSDFVKVTTTDPETGSIYYSGLELKVNKVDYKKQVIQFAQQAKELFDQSKEKQFSDEEDKEMYEEFWKEYNQLLGENLT